MKYAVAFILTAMLITSPSYAKEGISWQTKTASVINIIDWCVLKTDSISKCPPSATGESKIPRITEDTIVVQKVTNFNFIKFDLETTIDTNTVDSYVYLANFWGQLLSPSFGAIGIAAADVTWWKRIMNNNASLSHALQAIGTETYLSKDVRNLLVTNGGTPGLIESFNTEIAALTELRKNALSNVSSPSEISAFREIDAEHQKIVAALSRFVSLANKTLNGSSKAIGKQDLGAFVSISLAAKSRQNGETVTDTTENPVEYFTESKFPLTFHSGLTYNDLKDTDFKTVRTLAGRDLFSKIRDENGTSTFSVFTSYPLPIGKKDKQKLFATIGTDISDLGDNLYLGLSWKINKRWFISAGGAYGLQTAGEEEASDGSADGEPSRKLFEVIKEERDWGAFLSVSVKLY